MRVDAELGGRDAGAQDPLRVNVGVAKRQASERAAQVVERQTGIEQRAERHVAGDAGETIEVKDGRHALRCQCPLGRKDVDKPRNLAKSVTVE